MPKFLTRILQRFKTWLFDNSSFLLFWYKKKAPDIPIYKELERNIPSSIRAKLVKATKDLPNNQSNIQAISSAIDSSFEEWMTSAEGTNNSIIILSSPVTPVALILSASIEQWAKQKNVSLQFLPWNERPEEFTDIASKLKHCLEPEESIAEDLEIVVIPNLCWCFLRSIDGLEGIDYLQNLLLNDRHRFWIIGVEQTAWKYLNYVCNLDAYCGQTFLLPDLKGEELKEWLNPIVEELGIEFYLSDVDREDLEEDETIETKYFDRLAATSQGVSIVALEAFVRSINYQARETENSEDSDKSEDLDKSKDLDKSEDSDKEEKLLLARNPSLPQLPLLDSDDRYILYSLLLHQNLSLSALAESLGDELAIVQAKVQILLRKGIIEQEKEMFQINPIHYPRLKQELDNNNFIIED